MPAIPPLPDKPDGRPASCCSFRRNRPPGAGLSECSATKIKDEHDGEGDADSDLDFWGGEIPQVPIRPPPDPLEEESLALSDDASDEFSAGEDEEDVDGDNEEMEEGDELLLDRMEIFGHR